MTQKQLEIAGVLLAVASIVAAAAAAHADIGSRVDQTTRRVDRLEDAVEDIQWNISLLCERAGAQGCRSGSQ